MQRSESRTATEKEGSDQTATFRKVIRAFILGMNAVIILAVITYQLSTYQPTVGTQPQATDMLTLSMPANGDSIHIPLSGGYRVSFTGEGFVTRCVYPDGSEETMTSIPCRGGLIAAYVHDISGRPNKVTYVMHK